MGSATQTSASTRAARNPASDSCSQVLANGAHTVHLAPATQGPDAAWYLEPRGMADLLARGMHDRVYGEKVAISGAAMYVRVQIKCEKALGIRFGNDQRTLADC